MSTADTVDLLREALLEAREDLDVALPDRARRRLLARIDKALAAPPHCPACEARARRVYGWGIVTRNGGSTGWHAYRKESAQDAVASFDAGVPNEAPHRVVRLTWEDAP